MNSFEVTFHLNNETVTVNPIECTLDWDGVGVGHGFGQYINQQKMYHDLISILLLHDIDHKGYDLVDYGNENYWSIWDYNGKRYRVWFYNDGKFYVHHIDEYYDSVDDMLEEYTDSIFKILTAIINDHS